MPSPVIVRPIKQDDFKAWQPLWDGYNAFYGRKGESALAPEITKVTWQRFLDPDEPVFALVAESEAKLVGLTHYLFHRSTTRIELTCYLQDLFTAEGGRGRGIGRSLIEGVYREAAAKGIKRVYWQTHETNAAGRLLYEKLGKHAGFIVYGHDI
ncbi:GNAT family N-acetyltransferase [Undibacterium sp. Ren11W]|uniref:GNAT family N-acetyltransferase n=1 Tax=Undibacterium sp. Ren11W TaxID=3413045 RepID=UPI003BF0A674